VVTKRPRFEDIVAGATYFSEVEDLISLEE
jgi:hypothetical protein